MEHIKEAVVWLKTNWDSVLALWACVIGAAEIIVNGAIARVLLRWWKKSAP